MVWKFLAAAVLAASALAGPASAGESFVKLTPPVVLDDQGFYHPVRPGRASSPSSLALPNPSASTLTCAGGRTMVRGRGFTRVVAHDCSGTSYRYSGWRNGARYDIRVRAGSGQILSVRRGA
jgi:hypothetical protein